MLMKLKIKLNQLPLKKNIMDKIKRKEKSKVSLKTMGRKRKKKEWKLQL